MNVVILKDVFVLIFFEIRVDDLSSFSSFSLWKKKKIPFLNIKSVKVTKNVIYL